VCVCVCVCVCFFVWCVGSDVGVSMELGLCMPDPAALAIASSAADNKVCMRVCVCVLLCVVCVVCGFRRGCEHETGPVHA